jgi:hypothetical protein
MSQELEVIDERPRETSVAIEQKRSEAVSTIQSSMVIAKRFPRDSVDSYKRIIDSCKRPSLAQAAIYKYPKGGAVVTGPSIRLAECVAQAWGNLKYGFQELEQNADRSVIEAYCHDLESNTMVSRTFSVPHSITLKNGSEKPVRGGREIYELVANYAQRRVRACILEVVPGDVIEAAVDQCKQTLAKGSGEPMADRIRKCVLAFSELGVSQKMIEEKLEHSIDLTTGDELVDLLAVYNSLRDKQAKPKDFFKVPDEPSVEGKAKDLAERLRQEVSK